MSGGPRVLQVLQPEDGGVAEHVLLLSRGLAERGWEVEVACSPTNVILPALADSGIPAHPVSLAREIGRHDVRAALELRALDRGGRYVIVHAHSSKAGALARLVFPHRGARVIYTAHGFSFVGTIPRATGSLYRAIEQALVPLTGAIIAVSEFEWSNTTRLLRGTRRRLHLVPNGVPSCPEVEPDRGLVEFKGARPLAGVVTVLRPEKDPLTAIRAAALLPARGNLTGRLAVVGNGWLEGEVRTEIERLGLAETVRWFPFEGPMARYLRALDVLLLPSLWEALPLGPIEAMSCGVPVVATSVGGVPEVVEHGVTGLLFEPGSPAALAGGLDRLLTDVELRERMGEAGRAAAATRFGLDRMLDQTEALYHELLRR